MDCAQAQTNLYVLDPPSRSRTTIPAVLGKIIKRRGFTPVNS